MLIEIKKSTTKEQIAKLLQKIKFGKSFKVMTVDATAIALEKRLGSKTSPIVNTAILGAIVKALNVTNMDLIIKAIEEGVPLKVEENVEAAKKAYTSLKGGE